MSVLSTVRDLALIAGAGALAALAAQELTGHTGPTGPRAGRPLAPARHGWLCKADRIDGAVRIRPATAAEALATEVSQAAGDGGWFGLSLTDSGADIVHATDTAWARAGHHTYIGGVVEPVFVTDHPTAGIPPAPFVDDVQDLDDATILADLAELTAEDLDQL